MKVDSSRSRSVHLETVTKRKQTFYLMTLKPDSSSFLMTCPLIYLEKYQKGLNLQVTYVKQKFHHT